jgi:hypothetical protein
LVAPGVGRYQRTFNDAAGGLLPGMIVTTTDQAADSRDVVVPDAADEICTGVVGCWPGHDIETAYSAGDPVPVYMKGSLAEVWVLFVASGGAIKRGTELCHSGVTADGLAAIGAEEVFEHLGFATMDSADSVANRFVTVRLD